MTSVNFVTEKPIYFFRIGKSGMIGDYISRNSPENAIARYLYSYCSRFIDPKQYPMYYTFAGLRKMFADAHVVEFNPATGGMREVAVEEIDDVKVELLTILKKRVQRPATGITMRIGGWLHRGELRNAGPFDRIRAAWAHRLGRLLERSGI